jgi:uncharacterized protein YggE
MKSASNKTLAIVSVALSALLILGAFTVVWLLPRDAAPAAAQGASSNPSHITVAGMGSVSVTPDTVKITVGVSDQESTVAAAQSKVDSGVATITAKLKAAGIDAKDYRTVQYSIEPVMDYNGSTKGQAGALTGFNVTNMIEITLHDTTQAGPLLDSLVSAGANSVYGINFSVSNAGTFQQQAYDQAMQDAKSRAQKIAALSNLTLGKIVSVSENGTGTPITFDNKSAGLGGGAVITPGQQNITSTLVVTYEASAK